MYPEETNSCGPSHGFNTHCLADAVTKKQTEMEGISDVARKNRDRLYSVAERLSAYLDRQVGPRPSGSENDPKDQAVGIIFDINVTLRRQSQAIDHIENMLSHLEEIG